MEDQLKPISSTQTAGDILIVDDTVDNLNFLSRLLIERGYKVRAVKNGASALRAVEIQRPEIILLDIMMPDMDGYEVCRRLKENKNTREIPVLFISALDAMDDKPKPSRTVAWITSPSPSARRKS